MDGLAETAFADPPLTAVEIPWYDMLALGARLLVDLIEHRPPIEQIGICYSTRLIVRESTRQASGTRQGTAGQRSFCRRDRAGEERRVITELGGSHAAAKMALRLRRARIAAKTGSI